MRFQMTDPIDVLGEVHARLRNAEGMDDVARLASEVATFLYRRGHGASGGGISARDERLFWSKVDRRGPDDCWPWLGKPSNDRGHCRVWLSSFKGRKPVAQVSLMLDGRPRPFPEAMALHSCDHPPCCNPRHLRWGTSIENVEDRVARGRSRGPHSKDRVSNGVAAGGR